MSTMDVSVILRLVDQLSGPAKKGAAALKDLATQAKALGAVGGKGLQGLKVFAGLDKQIMSAATATRKLETNLRSFDVVMRSASINSQNFAKSLATVAASNPWTTQAAGMREVLAVQRELIAGQRAMAANSRAAAAPAAAAILGGRGGGGRGRGHGPLNVYPTGIPVPGGHLHMRGSNAALLGGGTLAYGIYEAARLEDQVAMSLWHAQMPPTAENKKRFSDIIKDSMITTGLPMEDVGRAVQNELRMFRGTPGGGLDVLPEMLKAAAVEARVKGSSLEESMTSLIGLAHMTKSYDPAAIKKLAPVFAFLSSSNPASLSSIERAAGYAVPMLQSGLEVDPLQTLLLGTALTRAGATNTKSGSWLREMALRAMPGTSLMSRKAYEKHEEALSAFGLVDKDGKPTWFDERGKPDLIKMLDIAGSHAAGIPLTKRAAYERALFGAQGGGGFALLADPKVHEQIANLKKEMPGFVQQYPNFLDMYKHESPVQQARVDFAELKTILIDIGETALPPVVSALRGLNDVLKGIKGNFGDGAAGVAGAAAAGGLLFALTRPGATLRGAGRLLGMTAGAAAGGAGAAGAEAAGGAAAKAAAGSRWLRLAKMGWRFGGPAMAAAALAESLYEIHNAIAGGKQAGIGARSGAEMHDVARGRIMHEALRRQFQSDTAEDTLRFTGLSLGTKRGGWSVDNLKKIFDLAPTDLSAQGGKAGESWFSAALGQMTKLGAQTVDGPMILPPGGVGSGSKGVVAGSEKHSSIGPVHIHVHGAGNPHEVADAVHKRFLASVDRHLSDGAYAS